MQISEILGKKPSELVIELDASPLFCRTINGKAIPLHYPGAYIHPEGQHRDTIPWNMRKLIERDLLLYRGSDSEKGFGVVAVFADGNYISPGKFNEDIAKIFFRKDEKDRIIEDTSIVKRFIDSYDS